MRELIDKEKEMVSTIVKWKQQSNLEELQVFKLLRKNLEFFALEWEEKPNKAIYIYDNSTSKPTDQDWRKIHENYFKIVDFLYFMEELENNGFIKLLSISFKNETPKERVLYDKDTYKYKNKAFWKNNNEILYLVDVTACHKVNVDIVDYLERYASMVIFPLPILEDYAKDFKTIELRQFNKQILRSNLSLIIAILSLIASTISGIIQFS